MPELPEVQTTVNGLNETIRNKTISDIWSDYFLNTTNKRPDTIKNKKYFEKFKKEIVGEKIKNAERRGKNVLIHLTNNKTILVHMKMTGHFLYGTYKKISKFPACSRPNGRAGKQFPRLPSPEASGNGGQAISKKTQEKWISNEKGLLQDPFNSYIHLIFNLSNGKHLAFSDMRKFAKVIFFETNKRNNSVDLKNLGPEPIPNLPLLLFKKQLLKKPNGKIKTVLMDQSIVVGIGNIYSDEILWFAEIHPERKTSSLKDLEIKKIWLAMKKILLSSIKVGGDSMSDYRNVRGEKGGFQNSHKVYRRTNGKCLKKNCFGTITRKIVNGRSSHFCNIHQI
jgi:formamidopyrimidine-DNA glycosylase